MSSHKGNIAVRGARFVLVNGFLLAAAAYLFIGTAAVRDTASRVLTRAICFVKDTAASSELRTLETQIAEDRATVDAAIERRDELQSRIRELVTLRNDAIARQIELSERLSPVFVALNESTNEKLVQVGDRLFDRSDVHGRVLELEARRTTFERQISESEKAIGQLMSSLNELDQRIAAAQRRIDSSERELHMNRHRLEGERACNDVLHHLESLSHTTR